jgi:hypothetical protein
MILRKKKRFFLLRKKEDGKGGHVVMDLFNSLSLSHTHTHDGIFVLLYPEQKPLRNMSLKKYVHMVYPNQFFGVNYVLCKMIIFGGTYDDVIRLKMELSSDREC